MRSGFLLRVPAGLPNPPTAVNNFYQFDGPAITVPAPGILANDNITSLCAGQPVTITIVTQPNLGTVVVANDGSFRYNQTSSIGEQSLSH